MNQLTKVKKSYDNTFYDVTLELRHFLKSQAIDIRQKLKAIVLRLTCCFTCEVESLL